MPRRARKSAAATAAEPMRVIVTKHRTYRLASREQGVAVEDYFAGVELPQPIKGSGAKVYHTANGPVIAMPAVKDGDGPKRSPRARRSAIARSKPTT